MVKQVRVVEFHQNRIDLDRELVHHPELLELLANHPSDEFEIRIAEISLYCDIALHGDYLPSDLDKLCGILRNKLWEKRVGTPIIIRGEST